jgi:outer membrane protein
LNNRPGLRREMAGTRCDYGDSAAERCRLRSGRPAGTRPDPAFSRMPRRSMLRLFGILSVLVAASIPAAGPFSGARAQEANAPKEMSLQEAISTALKSNTSVMQAAERVASGRIAVGQAKAAFLPDLSASVSGSRNYSKLTGPDGESGPYVSGDAVNTGLSSSVTLFDGLGNLNSLRAADLDFEASRSTYSQAQQDLIFNTVSDYLDVLMNGELVTTQTNNLEAQRQNLSLIQQLYDAGNRSLADLLQQKATVAQAELQLLEAQHQQSLSKLQLEEAMGLEPGSDYNVVSVSLEQATKSSPGGDADKFIKDAMAGRSDVAAQRLLVNSASRQVAVARSGYWPSLSLSFSGGSNYTSADVSSGFAEQILDQNPSFGARASIAIPIFDRLRTSSSVQQAEIALRNENLALDNLRQQVILEVRQAMLDYENALKQSKVAEAQVAYASQALEATNERYRVGAATLAELTLSQAQYVAAESAKVQADYSLALNRLGISYYAGVIDQGLALLGVSDEGPGANRVGEVTR